MERAWTLAPADAGRCGVALVALYAQDGPASEGIALAGRLEGLALDAADRAGMLRHLADMHLEAGRTAVAVEIVERALELATDPDQRDMLQFTRIQANKGGGRMDAALIELAELGERCDRGQMPPFIAGRYHMNAGFIRILLSDWEVAEAHLLAGRAIARELSDPRLDAYCSDTLVHVLSELGRLSEATALCEETLARSESRMNRAWTLLTLAQLEFSRGRQAAAMAALDEAEGTFRACGNAYALDGAQRQRALLLGLTGRWSEAEAILLGLLNRGPALPGQVRHWGTLAQLRILHGRFDEAREPLDTALRLAIDSGLSQIELSLLPFRAVLLAHDGDLEGARQEAERALKQAGKPTRATCDAVRALIEARWGDPREALAIVHRAEASMTAMGMHEQSISGQWVSRAREALATRRSARLVG
jgi:tetratricopeptide (TPR) repeat protein